LPWNRGARRRADVARRNVPRYLGLENGYGRLDDGRRDERDLESRSASPESDLLIAGDFDSVNALPIDEDAVPPFCIFRDQSTAVERQLRVSGRYGFGVRLQRQSTGGISSNGNDRGVSKRIPLP